MSHATLSAFWFADRLLANNNSHTRRILRIAQWAVAVSLAVMLLSTATITGFKREISGKMYQFWGHIHVTDATITRVLEEVPIDLKEQKYLHSPIDWQKPQEYTSALSILGYDLDNYIIKRRTRGGVRHMQAFATLSGIIQTKNEIEGINLRGVATNFDWQTWQPFLLAGRPIEPRVDSTARRDIIISQQTARRLQVDVGSPLTVHFVRGNQQLKRGFRVCGIYRTGLEEYDLKYALVSLSDVQELRGWTADQVAGIEIFLEHTGDMDVWADIIQTSPMVPNNMFVQTIKEKYPSIFDWLALQDMNQWVIMTLMAVVALINMTTVLLILITERTTTIGVMQALGAGTSLIGSVFIILAARVLVRGMFMGNVIGLSLAAIQKYGRIIKLPEADYYISVAPICLDLYSILTINGATFFVICAFLFVPSLLISKISPLKVLKFN